jgi:hypothetical protein
MLRRVIGAAFGIMVVVGLAAYGVTWTRTAALRLQHASKLEQLAKSMATYLNEDGEGRFYPATLGALVVAGTVKDPAVFVSPRDKYPVPLITGTESSYASCFDRYKAWQFLDGFPNTIMVWDRQSFFDDERHVAFFDYHVERVDAAQFNKLLGELGAAVKRHAQPRVPEY